MQHSYRPSADGTLKAVLLDISGVLYNGQHVISGSEQAFRKLQASAFEVRLVTNTSTRSPQQIIEKLCDFGFDVESDQLFTATVAAQHYLAAHQLKPYVLVHPHVQSMYTHYAVEDANCVLLGDAGDGFSYANMNAAFKVLKQGGELVVIGDNRFYRGDDGLQLDIGPFMKALEYAASCQAKVTGKPSPDFFKLALASIPCEPAQAMMVGDDVWSDCRGAIQVGLQAALVRTGKFEPAQMHDLPTACLVLDDLHSLVEYLGL